MNRKKIVARVMKKLSKEMSLDMDVAMLLEQIKDNKIPERAIERTLINFSEEHDLTQKEQSNLLGMMVKERINKKGPAYLKIMENLQEKWRLPDSILSYF